MSLALEHIENTKQSGQISFQRNLTPGSAVCNGNACSFANGNVVFLRLRNNDIALAASQVGRYVRADTAGVMKMNGREYLEVR